LFRSASIPSVECGSSGGVVVQFENVEVVYRLQQTHILDVVREYSPKFENVLIVDRVRATANAVCAKFSLQEVT
jgi:erlin